MTIDVDPDWWKTLFDDVYLVTDSRTIDNDRVTRQEIDLFRQLVPLRSDDRILDLCGGHGRHALELCQRGFRNCTVLDYSHALLEIGKRNASRQGLPIGFIRADARFAALADAVYDHVLILGNSLGYIQEPHADLSILQESWRLLKPRGYLLLDVTDGEAVNASITPFTWHEIGKDMVVCRQREIRDRRVCAREMVLSKTRGLIRDKTYCIRLYRADDLATLLTRVGFEAVQVYGDVLAQQMWAV